MPFEWINSVATWLMKKRIHQIELFMKYPHEIQEEVFNRLIFQGRYSIWGEHYRFNEIHHPLDFAERVPISNYEQLQPWIDRIMRGEQNVLWPTDIRWFAKSSGTTNDRSKFIPVTYEALEECHFKGGKDVLALYCHHYPDTRIFTGKGLTLGGSHQINQLNSESFYGDLSAVLMQNLPFWAEFIRTPELEVALMDNWEEKIARMGKDTIREDVTNASGVPTWTLLLMHWILEHTGKEHIHEIWPNLEVYFHGGVSFRPYREAFQKLAGPRGLRFMETYNASEGFFGIQDQPDSDELLLMLDYGIFYEFIPFEQLHREHPMVLQLSEVEIGKQYALVISTNGGLWRYLIGDTIVFSSILPYRFRISGRTKHYINAFGEELVVDNADTALEEACHITGARLADYTAGPVYIDGGQAGAHEWLLEFEQEPDSLDRFTTLLDEALRRLNSDYDAKRHGNMALRSPIIHQMPTGTFYEWLKWKGKLGGQNKVPRLSNDRKILDEVRAIAEKLRR